VLIRALARLRSERIASKDTSPDWKLVIVGEAEALRKEYEELLHHLAQTEGVSDNVVFAGAQSKVAECLSLSDIVVSANYKKPEAFGRSMAEALAMDRPVVAAAFGGALDIVEDGVNGALVDVDPKADAAEMAGRFAEAISKVSRTTFKDLRKNALEKFSFERMAASSLAVYGEFEKEIK
jgi:glycosyltransferase involved in cell wall biosynthesis